MIGIKHIGVMDMNDIAEKLKEIVNKDKVFEKEPMSKHTSFKIGGTADYFVKIESELELKQVLELVQKENLPFFILGNGTNLLVRDGGIRGVVIQFEQKKYTLKEQEDSAMITVQSRYATC